MPIYRFQQHTPEIAEHTFIAPTAVLIGQVRLKKDANIWFGAVLRGDNELIEVGECSNVQENCVLHTDMGYPLTIGKNVTIGHSVTLHGCTINDNSLIGMGATILNNALIGKNSIVGAGALVTENKIFPDGVLIVGSPAKMLRALTEAEIARLPDNATHYAERGQDYLSDLNPV